MKYQHPRANQIYEDLKATADAMKDRMMAEIMVSIDSESVADRIGAALQVYNVYFNMIAEANRSATVIEHSEEDLASMLRALDEELLH